MARKGGRYGPNVMISLALLLLDFLAFIVLLAGASALQHNSTAITALLNTPSLNLNYGDLMQPSVEPVLARRFISFEWFKAILQVVTLLFALGTFAIGQFHRFRIAIAVLLGVTTVLFIDAAQTFYFLRIQTNAANAAGVVPSNIAKEVRVWWAGCMMTAGLNLAAIVAIGSGLSEGRHHGDAYASPSATGIAGKPYTSSGHGTETAGTTVV